MALVLAKGSLSGHQQLDLCRDIASALIHVHETEQSLYSDLRPANVLLCSPVGRAEYLILCDFEQRGNWHEWNAPEILFRQYAENLRSNRPTSDSAHRWDYLVEKYSHGPGNAKGQDAIRTDSKVKASNLAWFSLNPESQEKAAVYSLGLFIYCVFEGLSNVRQSIANAYTCEPDVEFPNFKRTPVSIRSIIRRCTADAPEWKEHMVRARRIRRVNGRLIPKGWTEESQSGIAVSHVIDAAMQWWTAELTRAEDFLHGEEWKSGIFGESRPTIHQVLEMLDNARGSLSG